MTGHTTEEKLKILYEDSLRDIRSIASQMQKVAAEISAAANLVVTARSAILSENEKLLRSAVADIRAEAARIGAFEANVATAAASAARSVLGVDGGPLKQLAILVKRQQEALLWLKKAADFYKDEFVYWPFLLSSAVAGVVSGVCVGLIVRFA